MRIIDAHVHLYPDEANSDPVAWGTTNLETHWVQLCTRRRKDGRPVQAFPSVEGLIRAMDEAGVERTVLQGWYWQFPENCAWQNRFYARCVKEHPDRLSAFATLHPGAGRGQTLALVRSAREQGFCGLGELSPHSQGFDVADPVFQSAMELAGELHLPVNLHVTEPQGRPYPGRVDTPLRDFLWLARTFRGTNFILAHWGGCLPLRDEEAVEAMNLFFDSAASPLLYGPDIWRRFFAVVPPERVLFGSDFPLDLYPGSEGEPGIAGLVREAREQGVDLEALAATTVRLLHL